jgi:hypothetical protein
MAGRQPALAGVLGGRSALLQGEIGRGRVCLSRRLLIDGLRQMCHRSQFPQFRVRPIPVLLFVIGLAMGHALAEGPPESSPVALAHPTGDLEQRGQALEELRQLGRQATHAASEVLAYITDREMPLDLRIRAVLALRDIGLSDQDHAEALFLLLADPDEPDDLRRTILMAHSDRVEFAPFLVPPMLRVLADQTQATGMRRQVLLNLQAHLAWEGVNWALGRIAIDATDHPDLRSAAIGLLRMSSTQAPETVVGLTRLALAQDEPAALRHAAIELLGGIGPEGGAVAAGLVELIRSGTTRQDLRLKAVESLSRLELSEMVALQLVEVLFEPDAPGPVRGAVATLLAARERMLPVDVKRWQTLLETRDHPVEARHLAALSLAQFELNQELFDLCARLLGDDREDMRIRLLAAQHLRAYGLAEEPAITTVEVLARDGRQPAELREAAFGLWVQMARNWLSTPQQESWQVLNARLASIDRMASLLHPLAASSASVRQNLAELSQIRAVLAAGQQARWWDRALDWSRRHPRTSGFAGTAGVIGLLALILVAIWAGLGRVAPMRLWSFNQRLSRWDFQGATRWGSFRAGPRHLLLLGWRGQSRRVLDAWVQSARPHLRKPWDHLRRRHCPAGYVPFAARWNGQPHAEPPWDSVRQRLTVSGGGVLVCGEAGSGKTCCASEIVGRMLQASESESRPSLPLPVWIERPQTARNGSLDLSAEVRAALALALPSELLPDLGTTVRLLNCGRLLPCLDGVSEWPREWSQSVQAALRRLQHSHGSYLATTRCPEAWDVEPVTRLELEPLAGNDAVRFLHSYLDRRQPEVVLGNGQLLSVCQQWMALTEDQPMPVQVICMFGDVAAWQPEPQADHLVMVARDYLRLLWATAGGGPFQEAQIIDVAGRMAWAELARTEPGCGWSVAERQAALSGIADAQEIVISLEQSLGVLERWQPGDRMRFRQQPLAAHLAALHLIRENNASDDAWRQWFRDYPGSGGTHGPVFRALWSAGFRLSDPLGAATIPEWVCDELARRLDIDPRRRESNRQAAHARNLVRQILMPENPERSTALKQLAALGSAGSSAVPSLEAALRDPAQDLDVRFGALTALGLMGSVATPACVTLEAVVRDRREQLFIRLKALEFLAAMDRDRLVTVKILTERLADREEAELLRLRAGHVLAALSVDPAMVRSELTRIEVDESPPAVRDLLRRLQMHCFPGESA